MSVSDQRIRDEADGSEVSPLGDQTFRQLADAAPVLIWIADQTKACIWFNRVWLDFTGSSMAQEHGDGWAQGVHPEDFDRCLKVYIDAFDAREPFRMEYRLRHRDGAYRWILDHGVPLYSDSGAFSGYMGSCTDIDELKQSQSALSETEMRFQLIANSIPQLAWMARPDGHIFWYNARWHAYCGTTAEEMEGWGWQKVHDPEVLPRIVERWRAALTSGQEWEDVFPLKRHDGRFRAHLSRARPLRDPEGNVSVWFGTNTDIEEQIAQANERTALLESEKSAREEVERASQLKDEFLATLSHELRTPLNAILGWSMILRRNRTLDADVEQGLTVIERNARVQAQLIEDLLDMSRITSGKLRVDVQEIDINDVTNAALESVRPAADAKSIRLQSVLDSHVGPVRGDAARLQQVIWNLLSNAIKFTPKGGKVQVALLRVNSHIEISVTDNGIGISPDFLPLVFDRFRQADGSITRQQGGLGLGLAIVKSLVELHGGRVLVKSLGLDKGSTFVVELPLAVVHGTADERTHPRRQSSKTESLCDDDALAGLRVLVVDDEEDARSLICRVLEQCKAKVRAFGTSRAALEAIELECPDVILSDIGLPSEDGYEFIRKVRGLPDKARSNIPAAALTAFARSEDRTRALRAGFQSHIAKPVEPAELVAVVESLSKRNPRIH